MTTVALGRAQREDESMVAMMLANLVHEKFGGDSALELKRNFQGYIEQIRSY